MFDLYVLRLKKKQDKIADLQQHVNSYVTWVKHTEAAVWRAATLLHHTQSGSEYTTDRQSVSQKRFCCVYVDLLLKLRTRVFIF